MSAPAHKRATYQDLMALPDNVVGEIVAGELHVSPRPRLEHARVASVLGMDLGTPFERGRGGPGGWWLLDEPELHLGSDVLVPDLAGWRRERCPQPPSGPYTSLAPDWICEVLSPKTASLDRIKKLPIYARAQVAHAWVVDPAARSLEIFRRSGEHWLLVATHADQERVHAEPFEAIELELGALWLAPAEEG